MPPQVTHRFGPFARWTTGRLDVDTPRGRLTYVNIGGHRLYTPWGLLEWALRVGNPYASYHRSYGVDVDVDRTDRQDQIEIRLAYGRRRTEAEVTATPGEESPFATE